MTLATLLPYAFAGILLLIATIQSARSARKDKRCTLHFLFLSLAFSLFIISTLLNSFEILLNYPITQGIALSSGMIFLFCAALLFTHTNPAPA